MTNAADKFIPDFRSFKDEHEDGIGQIGVDVAMMLIDRPSIVEALKKAAFSHIRTPAEQIVDYLCSGLFEDGHELDFTERTDLVG